MREGGANGDLQVMREFDRMSSGEDLNCARESRIQGEACMQRKFSFVGGANGDLQVT